MIIYAKPASPRAFSFSILTVLQYMQYLQRQQCTKPNANMSNETRTIPVHSPVPEPPEGILDAEPRDYSAIHLFAEEIERAQGEMEARFNLAVNRGMGLIDAMRFAHAATA